MSGSEEYLDTVRRIEPDVHPLDRDGALASIAISLRRIADALESREPKIVSKLQRIADGVGRR